MTLGSTLKPADAWHGVGPIWSFGAPAYRRAEHFNIGVIVREYDAGMVNDGEKLGRWLTGSVSDKPFVRISSLPRICRLCSQ